MCDEDATEVERMTAHPGAETSGQRGHEGTTGEFDIADADDADDVEDALKP